jgi:hypothetical protein
MMQKANFNNDARNGEKHATTVVESKTVCYKQLTRSATMDQNRIAPFEITKKNN